MYKKSSSKAAINVPDEINLEPSNLPYLKSSPVVKLVMGAMLVKGSIVYAQGSEDSLESDSRATLTVLKVEAQPDVNRPYEGTAGQILETNHSGFLGEKDALDTPFSAISYTDKFIEDQQASDVVEVISATDASVYSSKVIGENLESYSIRGFSTNSNDATVNGLSGMAPYYRSATELYKRVEVQKGPSAMLNGMAPKGSIGGSVNLVTKRAPNEGITRLTTKLQSDSQLGAHLDVGRRYGENQEFGVRFNGAYTDGDTSIDAQDKESSLGALALDFRGDRLRLSLDAYDTHEEVQAPTRGITVASGIDIPYAPDASTPLNPSWAFYDTETQGLITKAEFDVSNKFSIYAGVGFNKMEYAGLSAGQAQVINSEGDYNTTLGYVDDDNERTSMDAGLRYDFNTAGVNHQLALNVTQYKETYNLHGLRYSNVFANNIYAPDWSERPSLSFNAPLLSTTETTLRSIGIADTVFFKQDKYQLTVGARKQQVETRQTGGLLSTGAVYDKDATTPSIAFLTRLNDQASLYANYIEGLSTGGTAPGTADNAGEIFSPYKTKQKEIGLKVDQGMFTHNFALFEIERPSSYTDSDTNVYGYYGEQKNRGFEWGFYGAPIDNVRLSGGVTYLDASITSSNDIAEVGNQASGVPKWQAKLGTEWDTSWIENLTLTSNITSVSKRYIDNNNERSLSAHTIYGVGARYVTTLNRNLLTIRLDIDNLMDKNYWSSAHWNDLALGESRSFKLSASLDF